MSSLLVFNRVCRLVNHVDIFDPSNLLTGSHPTLPCVNEYRGMYSYETKLRLKLRKGGISKNLSQKVKSKRNHAV
jgi:hypothetical protein